MFHKDERSNQKWWRGDPGSLSNQDENSKETSKTTNKNKETDGLWAKQQAPVVEKVDDAIHLINFYSVVNAMGFRNTSLARQWFILWIARLNNRG